MTSARLRGPYLPVSSIPLLREREKIMADIEPIEGDHIARGDYEFACTCSNCRHYWRSAHTGATTGLCAFGGPTGDHDVCPGWQREG